RIDRRVRDGLMHQIPSRLQASHRQPRTFIYSNSSSVSCWLVDKPLARLGAPKTILLWYKTVYIGGEITTCMAGLQISEESSVVKQFNYVACIGLILQ
ncbi:hypothetical protein AVEN_39687-1, partial [Araneus ventricosus]